MDFNKLKKDQMKKILVIILLCSFATVAQAQVFGEWFQQKKTQKKYLLQQIAALQVYIKYLQKGYAIAKEGLTLIGDIKNGEFTLHKDYFHSLKNVNPIIRNYSKVTDIVALQTKVIQIYNKAYKQAQESDAFHPDEISYIYRVYSRLIDDCSITLDELISVTTDKKLEMKDDERMERIDGLYLNMHDQYTFVKKFSNETLILAKSRVNTKNDVETSRVLQGINPE